MKKLFLLAGSMFCIVLSHAQDTARTEATLSTATVYFGYGAELTHQSKVRITPETKFIIINKLSTQVDINSLQISCPEDVALLSHKYNVFTPVRAVVTKSKEQERLEDSIALLQKDISRTDNLIAIEQEILTKTGNLIETTISTSGNKTITSEEVLKLVNFYNGQIEKSKQNIYNHKQAIAQYNQRIDALRKKISQIAVPVPAGEKPYGQVIMQVMCKKAIEIPVALSYYTNNAGWVPMYDVRVNSKTNKVKLVYKASVTQTSGIDWKNTRLTLSTGTPTFGATAPVLVAWNLQLYVPGLEDALAGRAAGANNYRAFNRVQSMAEKADEVVVTGYGLDRKSNLTGAVSTIDPSTLQQYTTLSEGQLNTNFEIELPYDIEADGKLHSVTIRDEEIPCFLKNYAVPRYDKDAYLLAEVADWQNLNLLPGEANIIMDDTYIGKSMIDPNITADTLNLSLGKDKRAVVKRSLVKEFSSLKTSGSTTRQVFTYEITVKNSKQTDLSMLLKDQYPLSTIKEIEVHLDEDGGAMVNSETGVLTWKIDLKPGESKKVRFSYSVRYPKDKKIVNLK
jgi:uncharacterized protein (TIGR02231 family)